MMEGGTMKQNEILNKMIEVLEKKGNFRSETERRYIAKILEKNDFFEHHIDKMLDLSEILYMLSTEFHLEKVRQHSTLMNYGDAGDRFYIILKGRAWVFVPKSEQEINDELQKRLNSVTLPRLSHQISQSEAEKVLKTFEESKRRDSQLSSALRESIFGHNEKEAPRKSSRKPSNSDEEPTDPREKLDDFQDTALRSGVKKISNMYLPRKSTLELEMKLDFENKMKNSFSKVILPMVALSTEPENSEKQQQEDTGTPEKNQPSQLKKSSSNFSPARSTGKFTFSIPELKSEPSSNSKKGASTLLNIPGLKSKISLPERHEEDDEDPMNSPRFKAYLQNTPPELLKAEDLALLSTKKSRNRYLKNGIVTLKMVAMLETGQYLGERALFHNSMRTATVVARDNMYLASLKKEPFQKIFRLQQESTKAKVEVISQLFPTIWSGDLKKLIVRFTEVRYGIGEHIFHQGEKTNGFYIVKEGEIKLFHDVDFKLSSEKEKNQLSAIESYKTTKKVSHVISVLGPNQMFGYEDLLDRSKYRRVSAVSSDFSTTLYHMSLEDFRQYTGLHNHPAFLDTLRAHSKLTQEWRNQKLERFETIRNPTVTAKSPTAGSKKFNTMPSIPYEIAKSNLQRMSGDFDPQLNEEDRMQIVSNYFKKVHGAKVLRENSIEEQMQTFAMSFQSRLTLEKSTSNPQSPEPDDIFHHNRLQKQARGKYLRRAVRSISQSSRNLSPLGRTLSISNALTQKGGAATQRTLSNHLIQSPMLQKGFSERSIHNSISQSAFKKQPISPEAKALDTGNTSPEPNSSDPKSKLKEILQKMPSGDSCPPNSGDKLDSNNKRLDLLTTTLHKYIYSSLSSNKLEFDPIYSPVTHGPTKSKYTIQSDQFSGQMESPRSDYFSTAKIPTSPAVSKKMFMKSKHNMFRVVPKRGTLVQDSYQKNTTKTTK